MKLQVPFIQLPVLFDAERLATEVEALGHHAWRNSTQLNDGNSAITLITAYGDPASDALAGPMRPTPALLQCPYLQQVLAQLGATWGRARLMRLSGQAEVKAHVDINYYWRERMRVHVPIVTTPSVRFRCGDEEVHMGRGECWVFDTWRRHQVLNGGDDYRIHLVADTVGGHRFFDLLQDGRAPGRPYRGEWCPPFVGPGPGSDISLDFESVNAPSIMGPWELREHVAFLLSEAAPDPRLGFIQQSLLRFSRRWQSLWACYGEQSDGLPRYRELLESTRRELLELGVGQIGLRNEAGLWQALCSHVFDIALAEQGDSGRQVDQHGQSQGVHAGAVAVPERGTPRPSAAVGFERPIFIVSPPRSGSTLLFETLAKAPGLYTIGDESHQLIEGVAGLSPSDRGYQSNRLDAGDADPAVAHTLRERFMAALRDRDGHPPRSASALRMLEKTPKNALRVPFLAKVFPDARFIFLHRDVRQTLGSMMDGWQSGRFRMYPQLPGWEGPVWSFLLTPGWQELSGKPLGDIVAGQWGRTMDVLLGDLAALDPSRWIGVDHDAFLRDPQAQVKRLCEWAGVAWDHDLAGANLPLSRYTLTRPDPDKWRRHAAAIEAPLAAMQATIARAEAASRH